MDSNTWTDRCSQTSKDYIHQLFVYTEYSLRKPCWSDELKGWMARERQRQKQRESTDSEQSERIDDDDPI